MIEFQNVSKAYSDKKILDHANFVINSQEFFVLVGPSGSGKTTTLKMINRLVEHSEGEILIDHQEVKQMDLRKLRLSIGYVLQQIALFPNLTVAENIGLIPEMKGWKKEEIKQRTDELLELVGLAPELYAGRKPNQLSGGEQQRVGILRAIASNPEIVLMDEPFSALDPISRRQLQIFIKDLQKKMKLTIVFVTHDLDEAVFLGDRMAVMHEGLIQQIAAPLDIQRNPENDFVRSFFKSYQQNLANLTVENLQLTDLSVEKTALTVSNETKISDLVKLLAEGKKLQYQNHQITADDIVKFMAGGEQ